MFVEIEPQLPKMSFDTVELKKGFKPLGSDYWFGVGFVQTSRGRFVRNDAMMNLTVYPNSYGCKDWVLVQASLPKIVFGHNAILPNEVQAREAATTLCEIVSEKTGLVFPVNEVKANRIDYTRDYLIQEERADEIASSLLSTKALNQSRTIRTKNTVYFVKESGGGITKEVVIYPKFEWAIESNQPEEVLEASRSKLRLEVRLRKKGLKGIKGASKPFDYISQLVSESVLNEVSTLLDLERISKARRMDFQEELIVYACGQKTLSRYGLPMFIELVKRHGEKFWEDPDFYYPKSTYYKNRRSLQELNIWDDLLEAAEVRTVYE